MSTYADGTQQTYQQIWASMELTCASLMPALRPVTSNSAVEVAIEWPDVAATEWPDLDASIRVRKHPLRRSARGRRKLAARAR
jgi:hypothetical protein